MPLFLSSPIKYRENWWPIKVLIFLLIVLNIGLWSYTNFHSFSRLNPLHFEGNRSPITLTRLNAPEMKKSEVVGMIAKKSVEAGIDPVTALRIAFLESSYNPKARHKVSSAKGLYMFIDKTWEKYCKGDVLNAEDNLNCFLKLYPKHPSWWVTNGK